MFWTIHSSSSGTPMLIMWMVTYLIFFKNSKMEKKFLHSNQQQFVDKK